MQSTNYSTTVKINRNSFSRVKADLHGIETEAHSFFLAKAYYLLIECGKNPSYIARRMGVTPKSVTNPLNKFFPDYKKLISTASQSVSLPCVESTDCVAVEIKNRKED